MIERTPEFDLAEKLIQETNCHLFLTGKAGTGKTTFLKYLKENCDKRMIVVAPTGVAAINAGGMTIHSFFQINFGPFVPGQKAAEAKKMRKEKIGIIRTLDLLIIDEISMVRADLLDAIDDVLRRIRRNTLPFGGVQLLMIGDTQQLTPVVKDDEWMLLNRFYDTPYFFSSIALNRTQYACVELKTIFRQADQKFIQLLNDVRENKATQETIDQLNKRYQPNFIPRDEDGYIQLTTHNFTAQKTNDQCLNRLKTKEKGFKAEIKGSFPENNYPNDVELKLKVGAQVMFIKNDSSIEKRYYNGKIGWIDRFEEDNIIVTDKKTEIAVARETWENVRYILNEKTNEIETQVDGTFTQYPLKTAWAITIHKSQGLTFDRAIIDAKDAFSHGQVYVALSRCKTLEGMILSTPLSLASIKHDLRVETFNNEAENRVPDEQGLQSMRNDYQLQLMDELFSYKNISTDLNLYHRILVESLYKNYPSLIEKMDKAKEEMDRNIIDIANRFNPQLRALLTEGNWQKIDERINKGIDYFVGKTNDIIMPIYQECGKITCDNKEVMKHLADIYRQLKADLSIKIATMQACKEGFNAKKFLFAKNNAELGDILQVSENTENKKQDSSKGSSSKDSSQADILNTELFEQLRRWRKERAEELNIPNYMVLSQTALINVSNYLPTTDKELQRISGIGQKTIEKYGKEICTIVEECIVQYNYNKNQILEKLKTENETLQVKAKVKASQAKTEKKEKAEKENTREISLRLFNEGKSIEEIAKERNLVVGTIESHLAECVKAGHLSIEALTTQKRLDKLKEFVKNNPEETGKGIIEKIGDNYTYAELRLAQWQISKESGVKN